MIFHVLNWSKINLMPIFMVLFFSFQFTFFVQICDARDIQLKSCDTGLRDVVGFSSDSLDETDFVTECFEIARNFEIEIRDPEFSLDYEYATWQLDPVIVGGRVSSPGSVWIAPVSEAGDILVEQASVLQINPAPAAYGGNGPEFGRTVGEDGNSADVVYVTILRKSRITGEYRLRMARILRMSDNTWHPSLLPRSSNKGYAISSFDPDNLASIYFQKFSGQFPNFVRRGFMWRRDVTNYDSSDGVVERLGPRYPKTTGMGRWIPETDSVLFEKAVKASNGIITQAAIYNTESKRTTVLFSDGRKRRQLFSWRAPELKGSPGGDLAFIALVEEKKSNILAVYKQSHPDMYGKMAWELWTEIATIDPKFPFLWSPEPFVNEAEGRSYILMESLKDRPVTKRAPSLIWVVRLPRPGDEEEPILKWTIGEEPQPDLGISHKNDPEMMVTDEGEIRAVYVDFGVPAQ